MGSLKNVDTPIPADYKYIINYIRWYQGLQDNKTPVAKAWIQIEGNYKWLTVM